VRGEDDAGGEKEEAAAEDLGDVQNFYVVLKPQGGRFRLINIGRKRLPDIAGHERNWAFVDMVADSGKEIEEELQRDTYETKTRGERVRPAARPAGEGVYALVREGGRTHLAWALELPKKPGPVQKAFNIPEEASLAISIANPEKRGGPCTAQLSEEQHPDYPKTLQKEFRGRKFATEDPRLLDYEGAEVIFIGARDNPEEAYHRPAAGGGKRVQRRHLQAAALCQVAPPGRAAAAGRVALVQRRKRTHPSPCHART
jgi:hypothetical protein